MKMATGRVFGAAIVGFSLFAGSISYADEASDALDKLQPTKLTFALFMAPNSTLGKTYAEYGKMLSERTKGKITVRYFWSGSLIGLPEALKAVGDGIADMGVVSGNYSPAEMPLTAMFEHPYNASDIWVGLRATSQMHLRSEHLQAELRRNRVKWVAPYASGSYQFFFGRGSNVKSVEDFKGKSLRTTGGARSDWHKRLGAEPIFMPVNEIYESVERGVVWGFENTLSLAEDLKHGEVAGTLLKLNSGVVMGASTAMNLVKWESFPPAIQKIILETGVEWGEKVQAKALIEREMQIVEAWKKRGITIATPDAKSDATYRETARQATDAAAAAIDARTGNKAAAQSLADLRSLVEEANKQVSEKGHPWK